MATMGGHQETPFDRALKDFKGKLSIEEQNSFEVTTLKDLQATIATIQAKQVPTRTTRNLRRLEGFLEAMESNAKVIEIFLNVHPFVAFIWGPMKILLQMASTSANAFNALVDAYQRISEHMPLFTQYQDIFETNPHMRHVLELNFQDILEFHSEALKFFKRSILRQTFDALWKQFDTKFGYILNNMQQHKTLLERQADLAEFEQAKQNRLLMKSSFNKLEEEALLSRKAYLSTWLSAADVRSDQEKGQETRANYPESGRWLLAKNRFRTWFNLDSASDPLLWVHGMPGSGKTILASLIIDEANSVKDAHTLYFYFRSGDTQKQTFIGMARSLLSQVLRIDDSKVSLLYETIISDGDSSLNTRKLAENLLELCLRDLHRTYIILDGLDECLDYEQKAIVSWMRRFIDSPASIMEPNRCMFLSQNESSAKSLLCLVPTISILPTDNAADIERYCHSWESLFKSKFRALDDTEFENIAQTTSISAKGMFLFAKLVMSNLFKQTSVLRIRNEMRQEIYPRELDHAYLRIQNRILDELRPARDDALQLLAWTICAIRPLTWKEIQGAVAIDMENGCVDLLHGSWSDDHIELCGPLIEEQPNGTLELVHATARSYLLRNAIVIPQIEHAKFASKSLEYLQLPAFQADLDQIKCIEYITNGTYCFMDYAFINWSRHVVAAFFEAVQDAWFHDFTAATNQLFESLDLFFSLRWQTPKKKPKVPKAVLDCMRNMQIPREYDESVLREKLMLSLASMHRLTSPDIRDNSAVSSLQLHEVVPRIRAEIERMTFQEPYKSTIIEHYGTLTAKCPKMYCDWFHEGFESTDDRDNHVNKHDRPHLCPHSACSYAKMGYTTAKELETHITAYHNQEQTDDEFLLMDETDEKDGVQLQPELELSESGSDSIPDESNDRIHISEPQRKLPTPASALARSRKAPTIFPCKLCSRKFTRQYNLKSHLRTHTGERPHACTSCGKAFNRSHDLKKHEELHTGQKRFVCTGPLPSGGTWGCGKKFARASALERHKNSIIGRTCVKQLQEEEAAMKRKELEGMQRLRIQPETDKPQLFSQQHPGRDSSDTGTELQTELAQDDDRYEVSQGLSQTADTTSNEDTA